MMYDDFYAPEFADEPAAFEEENKPYANEMLDGLNAPQAEAVGHIDGALLVLAGAGTGKTRVLTRRIAHMILSERVKPWNILAVTFTNKAAREMMERIEEIVGDKSTGMWVGTFHSIGMRIIRNHVEECGLQAGFSILDPDDQKRLIDQILKDKDIDSQQVPAKNVIHVISGFKDKAWLPDDVPTEETVALNGKARELYKEYQRRMEALNACDFGDLLLKPLMLLKNNPELLAKYQEQFKYVLVDEYQDTNAVQYLWLRLITLTNKNLCVVGDDDQSIYGWRGAEVGNILKFEQDFPGATVVRLEQNYRSTGAILKAASHLISHNNERHAKTLWTDGGDGAPIEVHPVLSDFEEGRLICDRVFRHIRDGGQYTDVAILVRSGAQTRSLEEQFIRNGLPYVVIGGLRFYERKEIRDALSYLKLVFNENHSLAFQRIVNVPKRGIGESTISAIQEEADSRGCTLFTAARHCVAHETLPKRANGTLKTFVELIDRWRTAMPLSTPDRLMEQILEDSGYLEALRNDKTKDNKSRIDNLKELVRAMQEYPDVPAFLEHVSLVMDEEANEETSVRLMTVHASKGLEFDTVFLPGFEDGIFPHQRSMNEEGFQGLEEERRLAYVAVTRAKRVLIVSYTASRRIFGQFQASAPSRFLSELPEESLQRNILQASGGGSFRSQMGSRSDYNGGSHDYGKQEEPLIPMRQLDGEEQCAFPVGSRIFHQKYGYGRIHTIDGEDEHAKLVINFDKAGQKKMLASLAKLQKV